MAPENKHKLSNAARGLWYGTISFGLVSVPVSLFPALRPNSVRLRQLAPDGTPLKRVYVCPEEDKQLDSDDIIRGYETEKGEMIPVSDEDLENIAPEKSRDISLQEFIDISEIPRFHFDRPYFLAPGEGSAKAYHLLVYVMQKKQQAGIARFVMRGKEYLVAILARDGLLMAETMRFADEVRSPDEIGLPEKQKADSKMKKQFSKAIDSMMEDSIDQEEMQDHYTQRLRNLVEKKSKQKKALVHAETEETEEEKEPARIIDLVDVFRERMRQAGEEESEKEENNEDMSRLSKKELYERAQEKEIPGRSNMSKKELVDALSA
ncbi:MAG: Ku protein [Candidatus Sumerlaeota bacterium]